MSDLQRSRSLLAPGKQAPGGYICVCPSHLALDAYTVPNANTYTHCFVFTGDQFFSVPAVLTTTTTTKITTTTTTPGQYISPLCPFFGEPRFGNKKTPEPQRPSLPAHVATAQRFPPYRAHSEPTTISLTSTTTTTTTPTTATATGKCNRMPF